MHAGSGRRTWARRRRLRARPAAIARELFADLEGIDIEPAAAVAVACLRDAVADGTVPRDAKVLLNITGGGRRRLAADVDLRPAEPVTVVSAADHEAGVLPPDLLRACTPPR